MAIDIITAAMNQLLNSIEIHWATINSNFNKISGGGDIEVPAEAFIADALAVQADVGSLLVLAGRLTASISVKSAGA